MNAIGWFLYVVFAMVLVSSYIVIRRGLAPTGLVATGTIIINVLLVMGISLAQGNHPVQAIIVGLLIGSVISALAVAAAAFFRANEIVTSTGTGQAAEDELAPPELGDFGYAEPAPADDEPEPGDPGLAEPDETQVNEGEG